MLAEEVKLENDEEIRIDGKEDKFFEGYEFIESDYLLVKGVTIFIFK